jgi:hypothetical protein
LLVLIFSFREKTGLVRKDILHWINELRNNGKKTVQDAMVSAENPKNDPKFRKFNIIFIKREG